MFKTMSRRGRLCLGIVAAALLGLCVSTETLNAQPQARDTRCDKVIDGHIVDSVDHEPVAAAAVEIIGGTTIATNNGGRFHIEGICEDATTLLIEHSDYVPMTRMVSTTGNTSVEIELQPIGTELVVIRGRMAESDMHSTSIISGEALERTRGQSFSQAVSEVPGVTQLKSASGMAKPAIRGQFGRRLQLLVDSVPHRSQQWGLDHAPEIDPFSAEEIRVVRGASAVRYGPSAIGGAIIVLPPRLLEEPGLKVESHLLGFLARGGGVATRMQWAPEEVPGFAFQVSGSGRRLTSSSTPNYALQNTAERDWNLSTSLGYRSKAGSYSLSYDHYRATMGVCACLQIESITDFQAQVDRERPLNSEFFEARFDIERPYQKVDHDRAIARARWGLDNIGDLVATYAFQFDHRSEFDTVRTATGPQFDFRLSSHDADVVLEHRPVHLDNHTHLSGSVGLIGQAQSHSYRGLPLIPDYLALGGGAFAIERLSGHDFELEAGVQSRCSAERPRTCSSNDFQAPSDGASSSAEDGMRRCNTGDVSRLRFVLSRQYRRRSGACLQLSEPLEVKARPLNGI